MRRAPIIFLLVTRLPLAHAETELPRQAASRHPSARSRGCPGRVRELRAQFERATAA